MRDVECVSRRGTNTVEVRNKLGADGGVSKVAFHHTKFALGITFLPIKFNLLALYHLEFALMCLIPIDISDNTRVFEIDDGIVNKELGGRGRVENVEVIIFDPRAIEIWCGMCLCVKGDGVLRVTMLASPYKVSVNTNLSEGDVACHLVLTILVGKNKWVLPRITAVIFTPPVSWVIRVIELFGELRDVGNGTRCGREGDGGVVLSKPNWFIALHVVV